MHIEIQRKIEANATEAVHTQEARALAVKGGIGGHIADVKKVLEGVVLRLLTIAATHHPTAAEVVAEATVVTIQDRIQVMIATAADIVEILHTAEVGRPLNKEAMKALTPGHLVKVWREKMTCRGNLINMTTTDTKRGLTCA